MLPLWMASILMLVGVQHRSNALFLPGVPPSPEARSPEALRTEGVNVTRPPGGHFLQVRQAPPSTGTAIDRTGWTVAVDSFQPGSGDAGNAIDGNPNTVWHSAWAPDNAPLPHQITIDMQVEQNVNAIGYQPRQDAGVPGGSNGNIGRHEVYVSTDGVNFGSPVAIGTYSDNANTKYSIFETRPARYVRLVALTEAGNRGPWTSCAELNIYAAPGYTPPPPNKGSWGPTIDFPTIPVAAAVEYESGKVLVWSASAIDDYTAPSGQTYTATYDPGNGDVSSLLVTNTQHDMFCPGISFDFDNRLIVTGGKDAGAVSIFNQGAWAPGPGMQIPRGYQSTTTCSDGRIFAIGGSWSGGLGGKIGEIFDPATNAWSLLPGCPVDPILTNDNEGIFRSDNHAWLFAWKDGSVFQAGPSTAMNWYDTNGGGGQTAAGNRGNDEDSMCGNAIMFDAAAGAILTVGGSPDYGGTAATGNAHLITIDAPNQNPTVTTVANMAFPRIFPNGVVLPDGKVFINGGQAVGAGFTDLNSILTPEMWDPATQTFEQLLANSIPRNYHSVSLLMLDGTVFTGGGGLCGPACIPSNHFDAQIFTPPYLLNSDGSPRARPAILAVSTATVALGGTLGIVTDAAIESVALVRYGSSTHTVNTDQRRLPLDFATTATNTYEFTIPGDAGVALPGPWMIFVLDGQGTPSVAKSIRITP
ncbi:MAG: hypothetical protein M1832_004480 [Thelocarpon impressellum]|nr:MAG: hypothetical protein M1832_004480 [Thelocarpon impressellum]